MSISCPKGHAFGMSKSEMVHCISTLEGVMTIPQHSLTSHWCWGSRSLSPVALVPNPCELCVAGRGDLQSPQRGPCDGPATAQASLFPVVALNTSLNFCANDTTPVPVTENQGFTLWHYVSSYHPCSSSLEKQNQKHLHNNRPKIIYG